MFDEMNLNESAEEVVTEAAPIEETAVAPVAEGPKSKTEAKGAAHAAGREKAKAKRQAKRDYVAAKAAKQPKEKLHLTAEEKAERREAKAQAKARETAQAVAKYIRMSPLKVNIVLDLIRGKNVDEALAILEYTPKDAAAVVSKVLKSAVANAENNQEMDRDALYVTECRVGPGPVLKRYQPHAQGRAFQILKRTSHITVVVAERA